MTHNLENMLKAKFCFTVPFDIPNPILSPQITIGGVPWQISISKKHRMDSTLQVNLVCNYVEDSEQTVKWSVEGEAKLKIFSFDKDVSSIEVVVPKTKFNCNKLISIPVLIPLDPVNVEHFMAYRLCHFEGLIRMDPMFIADYQSSEIEVTSAEFGVVIQNINAFNKVFRSQKINLRGINWYIEITKQDIDKVPWMNVQLCSEWRPENFGWSFEIDFEIKMLPAARDGLPIGYSSNETIDYDKNRGELLNFSKWDDLFVEGRRYAYNHLFFEAKLAIGPKKMLWDSFNLLVVRPRRR